MQGELALQRGDDDGSIAAYLSMIAFRGFRFSRSRRYARLALTKNPSLPIPRELLVLSWLVYFPPFLLGHIVMNALQWAGRWKVFSFFITLVAFYVLGLPALLLSHMLVSWTGLGFLQTALLTLGFGFYLLFIGSLAKLLRGSKPKEVVLRDY